MNTKHWQYNKIVFRASSFLLVSVNGRGRNDDGKEGLVPSEKQEEQPFIVVAATVENDASSDPNEAFIPTKVFLVKEFLSCHD